MYLLLVENKYTAYEQRISSVPNDAFYKQMTVLDKVTENALKVRIFHILSLFFVLFEFYENKFFLVINIFSHRLSCESEMI